MGKLNAEQLKAAGHKNGPCLVLAGPGTGKTTVIVEHVKALIEAGVHSGKILVLTFTKAAAREMEGRFMRDVSEGVCGGMPVFGTFHSLCFSVLKEEKGVTAENIVNDEERLKILKYTLRKLELPDVPGGYLTEVSALKSDSGRHFADEENEHHIKRIFREYCENMRRAGKIDFDDMINDVETLFSENSGRLLKKWQNRFDHILLDEAQDLSTGQLHIAYMLAGDAANIFMVGDDDQSIYGFRGVSPKNLFEFKRSYPNAEIIRLSENYRSVPAVSRAALELIGHNAKRFKKSVENHRRAEDGVEFTEYPDEAVEAEDIARRIMKLENEGCSFDDIAVLCRTASGMRPIVKALCGLRIPFRCEEMVMENLTAWVTEDLNAYMGLASDVEKGYWNRGLLTRVMNRPKRGLVSVGLIENRVMIDEWIRNCSWDKEVAGGIMKLRNDTRSLGNMSAEAALAYIWHGCGYGGYVREECERTGTPFAMAESAAEEWVRMRSRKARRGTFSEAVEPSGETSEASGEPSHGVRIMTMHASKGLEFRHVFLPTMNEGVMPGPRSGSESEMEEERRLMYVAVTRAKDCVMLSCVDSVLGRRLLPSRFLKELGVRHR